MATAIDWLSLSEAKRALNIADTDTSQDVELALYVTAVSQRLDEEAGAAVIRTVTDETHDVPSGGTTTILLDYRPVASITSVVEYTGTTAQTLTAETNAAKTANDYLIDSDFGWLLRRASGSDASFALGRGNVVVTYAAGRWANTTSVSEKFKLAASIFLAHLWRREQGSGSATFGPVETPGIPTFGLPNVVRDILHDEMVTNLA